MNPAFVADASIVMAWTVASRALPALWPFEVPIRSPSFCAGEGSRRTKYQSARLFLDGLRVSVDEEGIKLASSGTADLALEYGLTVYDAAYLELAISKQIPLASADGDLNKAARRSGVRLLL